HVINSIFILSSHKPETDSRKAFGVEYNAISDYLKETLEKHIDDDVDFVTYYNTRVIPFISNYYKTSNTLKNLTAYFHQYWVCHRCGCVFENPKANTESYPTLHMTVGNGMRSFDRVIDVSGLIARKGGLVIKESDKDDRYRKMGFANHKSKIDSS